MTYSPVREALRKVLKEAGLCPTVDRILDASSSVRDAWDRLMRFRPEDGYDVARAFGVPLQHSGDSEGAPKCPVCFPYASHDDIYKAVLDAFKRQTGMYDTSFVNPKTSALRAKAYSQADWEAIWAMENPTTYPDGTRRR